MSLMYYIETVQNIVRAKFTERTEAGYESDVESVLTLMRGSRLHITRRQAMHIVNRVWDEKAYAPRSVQVRRLYHA